MDGRGRVGCGLVVVPVVVLGALIVVGVAHVVQRVLGDVDGEGYAGWAAEGGRYPESGHRLGQLGDRWDRWGGSAGYR